MTNEVENLFLTENPDALYDKDRIYTLPVSEEKHLNAIIHFIEENWQNVDFKVEDFEQPLGMSKTQVYRKFMLLTGKSPNSFLKEYRLNHALERINENIQTISETAYETGFNSQSYFSKCFYRRFHLLPSDYIKT
jgi:AraC-like DNA-binding protein